MSKLKEILISGKAPGVRCGESAVDPQSVYALAPKAIKEIERGERRSKSGIGAKDISKYMGMSVDNLKKVWTKSNSRAFGLILVFIGLTVNAQDITPGTTFTANQLVQVADMNNLVGLAKINPYFYTRQPVLSVMPNPSADSIVYIHNSSLYQMPFSSAWQNPSLVSTLPYGSLNPNTNDSMMYYSSANQALQQVSWTNLIATLTTNINPALISFGNATNYYLTNWPTAFSPLLTNNQPQFLVWGTNGAAYQQSYSNIISSAMPWIGTNLDIPYVNAQIFKPWTVYGTNMVAPYTNAWGATTNFAITNIYMFGNSNVIALNTNDSLPIVSTLQGTNTTATVGAMIQFLQSLNALPNYTQARVQFGGATTTYTMVNTNFLAPLNEIPLLSGNPFTSNTIKPFSIMQLSLLANFGTTVNGSFATNQIYYGIGSRTTANRFLCFTNYTDATNYIANVSTNAITYAGGAFGITNNTVCIVTNFTSFNCDVVPIGTQTLYGTAAGVYDIWFRTPAASANYYLSGSVGYVLNNSSYPGLLNLSYNNGTPLITTNRVRIDINNANSAGSGGYPSRAYVLISTE